MTGDRTQWPKSSPGPTRPNTFVAFSCLNSSGSSDRRLRHANRERLAIPLQAPRNACSAGDRCRAAPQFISFHRRPAPSLFSVVEQSACQPKSSRPSRNHAFETGLPGRPARWSSHARAIAGIRRPIEPADRAEYPGTLSPTWRLIAAMSTDTFHMKRRFSSMEQFCAMLYPADLLRARLLSVSIGRKGRRKSLAAMLISENQCPLWCRSAPSHPLRYLVEESCNAAPLNVAAAIAHDSATDSRYSERRCMHSSQNNPRRATRHRASLSKSGIWLKSRPTFHLKQAAFQLETSLRQLRQGSAQPIRPV